MIAHYLSALALVVFSIALIRKIQIGKRKGIKSNHMISGQKPLKTKIAEAFVVSTNYPLLFLWFFIIIRVVVIESWFPMLWVMVLGAFISMIGAVIYAIAIITLGDSWRVGIEQNRSVEFVNRGIYRWSRHPAYLGFALIYIGLFLTYSTWWVLCLGLLSIIALVNLAMEEELYLSSYYPEHYSQYQKRVGFILPKYGK